MILTVMDSFCSACRMKLLTTRPSFMCMRGPYVLKMRATRTSRFSWNGTKDRNMVTALTSRPNQKGHWHCHHWPLIALTLSLLTSYCRHCHCWPLTALTLSLLTSYCTDIVTADLLLHWHCHCWPLTALTFHCWPPIALTLSLLTSYCTDIVTADLLLHWHCHCWPLIALTLSLLTSYCTDIVTADLLLHWLTSYCTDIVTTDLLLSLARTLYENQRGKQTAN